MDLTSIIVLLFVCKKKQYMIIQVFSTLIGSKANSSNDNPCDWRMDLFATNWIGTWIHVIIWDWFLMSLIIGSIGVQFGWILYV